MSDINLLMGSSLLQSLVQAFTTYFIVLLAIAIISIISMWVLFTKAGRKGWSAIVPGYNLYVLFQVVGLKPVLLILFLIPFVNFVAIPVFMISSSIRLAHSFGKSTAFGLGLFFLSPIFYPMLAFSKNTFYIGPNGSRHFDSPQPTSGDSSKPQNYRNPEEVSQELPPVISMGSGTRESFHSAPIPTVESPVVEEVVMTPSPVMEEPTYVTEPVVIPSAIEPTSFGVETQGSYLNQDINIPSQEVKSSFLGNMNESPEVTPVAFQPFPEAIEPTPSVFEPQAPLQNQNMVSSVTEVKPSFLGVNNMERVEAPAAPMNDAVSSFLTPPTPPKVATFIADAELPREAPEYKVCSNCGAKMNPSMDTCFLCGKSLNN